MKFWWVNHKQTVRQEISGGYLWSPKKEANGARSQFYENMRLADPGDFVLSYANGRVGHAGVVIDFPFAAPRPEDFGSTGMYWNNEGWLLPVSWLPLPEPIPPKNVLRQIAPLLPTKYSPIQAETGNGNQKAYLAEIDERLFSLVAGLGGVTESRLLESVSKESGMIEALEGAAQRKIEEDTDLSTTEKQQVVWARRGQGVFRDRVRAIEPRCRITHLESDSLLIASHIKPWRSCSSAVERLDGENGLLLAPHVDHLFDKGFISFSDDGEVLISPRLDNQDLDKLGLGEACKANCGNFSSKQSNYLAYHRESVLLP
jgi:putative restriction endonuclease